MSGIQEQETVPKKRYTNRVTIQRVYANKGDNSYNYQGVKDDKFSGVMIDDQVFWIDKSFATIGELARIVSSLNVHIDSNGMWGRVDCEGWLKMDKRVVKVNRHHDEFFNEDTVYFKKAKFNTNGKFWWSVADIKEYFGEAFNICNADCQCAKKVCA